jgi:transcriptional regulator with XRE-family HTH domain
MTEHERVTALRIFLMERRARLKPSDVGLPTYGARRCPGLRREEVAELVGVSPTWYTLFEVARGKRRVSIKMVERVASALHLNEAESATLLCLAIPEIGRTVAALIGARVDLSQLANAS